ncbi:MAG: CoB--CoM heterodisulfide reductase iron-sulfur subunit A family protein [Thermodesulfobacteriota bacterium]|jgi:heterodisulfide reductase subunit A|nr:MAG: CoB--CoM heterodisulfide reductase iron-sulfur subunit A family protein [Thermodesulfobacteriota bacterium]
MKLGVYICHCGVNIKANVNVAKLTKFAEQLPRVRVARDYLYMCSEPGQQLIKKDIEEHGLDRVVVAACSPRMHEITFRKALRSAGLNPHCLEIANIREQCSWVHEDRMKATQKAQKLLAAAVSKAALLEPLEEKEVEVTPAALVVGGGIAGIQAALDIADTGYKVYLVEKEPSIGGHMIQLDKTFPTLDCSACILTPKMADVGNHPNIELFSYSEVVAVKGFVGNFEVTIKKKPRYIDETKCNACGQCAQYCSIEVPDSFNLNLSKRKCIYIPFPQSVPACYVIDPDHCRYLLTRDCTQCLEVCKQGTNAIDFTQKEELVEVKVGTIVIATGYDLFDVTTKPEYGYHLYDNVITGLEFERLSNASGPTTGEIIINGKKPKDVVFIQCVGSRDKTVGNEYCSRVCCMYTAKQAHLVREKLPQATITVFYMDVRAFGKGFEEFYDRVKQEGVKYRRGNPSEVYRRGDRLVVKAEDTLQGELVEVEADLVVLASGIIPNKQTAQIASLLKLSQSPDRFLLEAHPKLRPVDSASDGIFLAGCCQGPKDIPDSVAQASAAAAKSLIPLSTGKVIIQALTSFVQESDCRGCGFCVEACPFDAIELREVKRGRRVLEVASVNEVLCKGCGVCASVCLSGAIQQKSFADRQILSMVAALGEEYA